MSTVKLDFVFRPSCNDFTNRVTLLSMLVHGQVGINGRDFNINETISTSTCKCPQSASSLPLYIILVLPIAAAIGNLAFFVSVLNTKKLRTVPNFFLVSDSLADFVVSGIMMPLRIMFWVQDDCWASDHTMCQLFISTTEYFSAVSLTHAAAVSIERHVRLFRSSFYNTWIRKIFIPIIVVIWIYPTIFTYVKTFLPSTLGTYPYNDDMDLKETDLICRELQRMPNTCNCLLCFKLAINLIDITGQAVVPLAITFVMYGHIMYVAHRRIKLAGRIRRSLEETSSNPIGQSSDRSQRRSSYLQKMLQSREFRSIRLFLVILLVLCVCVIPSITNHFAILFSADESIRQLRELVISGQHVLTSNCNIAYEELRSAIPILLWSNSLINPMLLFILNRNYRFAFRAVLSRMRRKTFCMFGKKREMAHDLSKEIHVASDDRWNRIAYIGE